MVTFNISDMTCGHCASAISRAVASVDSNARLDIRIQQKLVRVESTASAAELAQAIQAAGYTPQEVRSESAQPAAARAVGCGCGCGPTKAAQAEPASESTASSCCS